MATLQFPFMQHLGKLTWDKDEEKLSKVAIENAILILYYMGYNASEALDNSGIFYSMRRNKRNDKNDYRNILFDFVLLFEMFDIKFPNIDYVKELLKDLYTPLEENNIVSKSHFIILQNDIYLVQPDNYRVSGVGYNISNLEMFIDQFNDGDDILPLIAQDKFEDLRIKIRTDLRAGTNLNDPFKDSGLLF